MQQSFERIPQININIWDQMLILENTSNNHTKCVFSLRIFKLKLFNVFQISQNYHGINY